MGAVQFIENLDRTSLTISDGEFEKRVEEAVSIIAERHKEELPPEPSSRQIVNSQISEKSTLSQPQVVPRNSVDVEYSTPGRPSSSRTNNGTLMGSDGSDENTAVSGLLRTIQKPLSSLGRMFSEDAPNVQHRAAVEGNMYQPDQAPRLSPAVFQPPRISDEERRSGEEARRVDKPVRSQELRINAEDAAARQASAEAAEAQKIQRAEHHDVVESVYSDSRVEISANCFLIRTLAGMFPGLDRDIIDDVVRVKQGRSVQHDFSQLTATHSRCTGLA